MILKAIISTKKSTSPSILKNSNGRDLVRDLPALHRRHKTIPLLPTWSLRDSVGTRWEGDLVHLFPSGEGNKWSRIGLYFIYDFIYAFRAGAFTEAKSNGKLCALRSCITSIPRLARLITSAHVLITRPCESTTDWLKLNPFRLNAIVEIPSAVNQIHTTGQAARKK